MRDVQAEELRVELESSALRKELRLSDLVLSQVLNIVGLSWIGTAAKLGSAHLVFWLAAIVLFYLPSAVVVIRLNRDMPLEGGVYQWAKLRLGEFVGFLVAWNLWIYAMVLLADIGVLAASILSYLPGAEWLSTNRAFIFGAGIVAIALMGLVSHAGLALGRLIHGLSGALVVAMFLAMLALAIPKWIDGPAYPPLSLAVPAFTLFNLNILGKMGFGALGGFDTVAIFAGECRDADAAKVIRRSVWIASPIIAAMFIVGTAAALVFSSPDQVDLAAPIVQVLSLGARFLHISPAILAGVGGLIVVTRIGQSILVFNATVRLPLVTGWDHLLPAWFTKLHSKHRTPTGSIVTIAGFALLMSFLGNTGVGAQEAYQLFQNGAGILYAVPYLALFLIPILDAAEPLWYRGVALSGFLMTLLYAVLSVFPIVRVAEGSAFTVKLIALVVAVNIAGSLFYWNADRRRKLRT